jgi:hypothetical protein
LCRISPELHLRQGTFNILLYAERKGAIFGENGVADQVMRWFADVP